MSRSLKIMSAVVFLFAGCFLSGSSVMRPQFTSVKVNVRLMQPPQVKVGSVSSASRGKMALTNRRWGVVEVSCTPRFDYDSKKSKSKDALSGVWFDDVALGVQLVLRDGAGKNAPAIALFSTTVNYWTIPADNKEHRYFVYLPPLLLERVMPVRRDESKSVKVAAENDFVAKIVFFHKKYGVIGEGYTNNFRYRDAADQFKELTTRVPANNVFNGALLSRSNSPWGVSDMDQFDLEKPAFIPAPLDDAAIDRAAQAAANEERQAAESSTRNVNSGTGRKNRKNKK